ncbi:hypothetical protein FOC4_g10003766 [Fusarium odoratissimum]|uniref:Clr5 domain-containing protein n=1 Tax=Fusarium oxysporum f. sp. cubense (strain race 4) TaxID=2502994 RepID=N1RZ80_FUSC4|nr:hypothetical protein FOC4_g10003766 [Fusarium odoratissimum]
MAQNRPGVSVYSRQQWQAIHPIFRNIYMDRGYSLEKTLMVLELINNFKATKDAFQCQIKRNWRDCAKNNGVARGNRTRAKRVMALFPNLPDYIAGLAVGFFDTPPSQVAQQDNNNAQDEINEEKEKEQKPAIGGRWYRALSLCQEISILPQKKRDFIVLSNRARGKVSKKVFKQEGIKEMKDIITRILNEKVFTRLGVNEKESTPKDLPALWSVCRVLRGLSSQLGYPEDSQALLMKLFLDELRESFTQITQGSNTEMGRVLELVRDIPLADLKDIAAISCLCSARALSSRLEAHDPVVLEAWADYYQYHDRSKLKKDVFLAHYKRAYEEAKAQRQTAEDRLYDERTLLILIHYSYAAHYICHEKTLADQLSSELWDQTGALLAEKDPPEFWSVKVQGMAEAAKIQALLCYETHEDNHKSYEGLRKNIHKYNLANTHAQHQYHDEVLQESQKRHGVVRLPPYDLEAQFAFGIQQIVQGLILSPDLGFQLLAAELCNLFKTLIDTETLTTEILRVAATKLDASNDQDCQLLAAGLYGQLDSVLSACRKDLNSIIRSVEVLFRKAVDSPLTEMGESNLKRYLEMKRQHKRVQGKECRHRARRLRQLVVDFENLVEI